MLPSASPGVKMGEVSQAIVNLDSADSISSVTQAITDALGSDRVDVVSDAERVTNVTRSLQGAQRTTSIGMFVGLGAGAAVVLVAMVLVVQERRREIGMFKAIGASNRQVVLQFAAENLAIAVLAVVLGLLVAQLTIKPVAAQTLPDTQPRLANVGGQGFPGFGGGGGQFALQRAAALGGGRLGLGNINAGLTAGSALLTAGSGLAIVMLTTLATAWFIARIRPAEVLRSEG
jgi:putative ABC transport system permease protein